VVWYSLPVVVLLLGGVFCFIFSVSHRDITS
jgi:hypothetical protein